MTRHRLQDDDKDGVINVRDKCALTPLKADIDNDGCQKSTQVLRHVGLNLFFSNNSYVIRPRYDKSVKKLADFMQKYPESRVVIEGHTDNVGSHADNLILSLNRAKAIEHILVKRFSIDAFRIKIRGYSEDNPIGNNDTALGKRQNRRAAAEISIQTKVNIYKWDIELVDTIN